MPISPIFQFPLYEVQNLDFIVNTKQGLAMGRVCPILMLALIDPSEKRVSSCISTNILFRLKSLDVCCQLGRIANRENFLERGTDGARVRRK